MTLKMIAAVLGIVMLPATVAHAAPVLLGEWHLDEGTGTGTLDTSGHGNLGVIGGSPLPQWTTRRFDTAALTFSHGGIVTVTPPPNSHVLEPKSALTVEAWVLGAPLPVLGSHKYIVAKEIGYGAAAYAIETGDHGGLTFYARLAGGTQSQGHFAQAPEIPASLIWDNKWHHVAGTYDGKEACVYRDGSQYGTCTKVSAPTNIIYSGPNLYIGNLLERPPANSFGFSGAVDEVRIWDTALSPSQILMRYQGY